MFLSLQCSYFHALLQTTLKQSVNIPGEVPILFQPMLNGGEQVGVVSHRILVFWIGTFPSVNMKNKALESESVHYKHETLRALSLYLSLSLVLSEHCSLHINRSINITLTMCHCCHKFCSKNRRREYISKRRMMLLL